MCKWQEATIVPLDDTQVDECLNYVEQPVAILDRKMKALHNKVMDLVKVKW